MELETLCNRATLENPVVIIMKGRGRHSFDMRSRVVCAALKILVEMRLAVVREYAAVWVVLLSQVSTTREEDAHCLDARPRDNTESASIHAKCLRGHLT